MSAALVRLFGMTQSGQAGQALPQLIDLLGAPDSLSRPERAAALYITAIAQLETEDVGGCHQTLAALLDLADAMDEPGWRCCALSLRVVLASRTENDQLMVQDILGSEEALQEARADDVRSWAACGLGWAYMTMRCHELADRPLLIAIESKADVIGLPESAVIDWANLAEAHLRSAFELEQIGDARHAALMRVEYQHVADAAQAARAAADCPGVSERWTVLGDLMNLAAERANRVVEPERVVDVLERANAFNVALERVVASALLTLVLSDNDQHDAAMAAGDRAQMILTAGMHDDDLTVLVTWAATRAAARAGLPGAQVGLRHAQVVARRSRRERLVRVSAVREGLQARHLAREHEIERGRARHDALTGLANLRALQEWIGEAQTDRCDVTMVVVDLDGLKAINDSLGHACGDAALRTVSASLDVLDGLPGMAARTGGDEFVLVIREEDEGVSGLSLEQSIYRQLAQHRMTAARVSGSTFLEHLTVSLGSASTREGLTIDQLYRAADERMYAMKSTRPGRGADQS